MQNSNEGPSPAAPYRVGSLKMLKTLVHPRFWERHLSRGGTVFYQAPTGRILLNKDDLERYLAEPYSCRCGFRNGEEYVFNFGHYEEENVVEKPKILVAQNSASTSAQSSKTQFPAKTSAQDHFHSLIEAQAGVKLSCSPKRTLEGEVKTKNSVVVVRNLDPGWAPLVEADPSLLRWACYSWIGRLTTREYTTLTRDLLEEVAEDSTTELVEMYCILEGLPRKDVSFFPHTDDNFMAWVGQHDWSQLRVQRATGHIYPKKLTKHQLTHLLASTIKSEEMEDQEESLRLAEAKKLMESKDDFGAVAMETDDDEDDLEGSYDPGETEDSSDHDSFVTV